MKKCKQFKQDLVLYIYDELTTSRQAELEVHLQICARCRQELAELRLALEKVPAGSLVNPPESLLQAMRAAVSAKIKEKKKRQWRLPSPFSQPLFTLVQGAVVCFVFVIGVYSGTRFFQPPREDNRIITHLITGENGISNSDVAIRAYLSDVKKLNYDAKDQTVEIHYSTINKIKLRSPLQNPEIQTILRQALLEKNRPAVRLDAVRVIKTIMEQKREIDKKLITNLTYLIQNEQNDGVRLQAMRALKTLPLDEQLKEVFIKVLLLDNNTAMRIEAFTSLTNTDVSPGDIDRFLKPLTTDTDQYFRFRAGQLLMDLNDKVSDL